MLRPRIIPCLLVHQGGLVKVPQGHVLCHGEVAYTGIAQGLFGQAAHLQVAVFCAGGVVGLAHHAHLTR